MLGLAANGEGQPKHPQDAGQDPGAKQLEGNIQPDADAVEAEAQDGWMLVNASRTGSCDCAAAAQVMAAVGAIWYITGSRGGDTE